MWKKREAVMETMYLFLLSILVCLVYYCIYRCTKSKKDVRGKVIALLRWAVMPLVANAIVIMSRKQLGGSLGYSLYFISTDWLFYHLIDFTLAFCQGEYNNEKRIKWLQVLLLLDGCFILTNPLHQLTFTLEMQPASIGGMYYVINSNILYNYHLVLSYLMLGTVVVLFLLRILHCSRLEMEKYLVIELSILITIVWESVYIFLKLPFDTSMIGYGVCALLIYYFSIEYTPILLRERMISMVAENLSASVFFYDSLDHCIYMNESAYAFFGVERGDYARANRQLEQFRKQYNPEDEDRITVMVRNDFRGSVHTFRVEYRKLYDEDRLFIGSFINLEDRTEELRKYEAERYNARHDKLTGLFNREHFYEEAEVKLAGNPDTEYVIVAANIRRFKLINDIFGKEAGDKLLIQLAQIIGRIAGPGGVYGRIGSDRFGCLIPKEELRVDDFEKYTGEAFRLEGNDNYRVIVHVGLYDIHDRSLPVSVMVDRASIAIASIKDQVNERIKWYDEEIRKKILWEQFVTGNLDEAIAGGQIIPYLQAQVDHDGKMVGAEVLVRWNHPREGLMSPARFVPVFENNGRIVDLDKYMWEEACRILRKWKEEGKEQYHLSVNISPKDFYYIDIYKTLTNLVRKYDLDPSSLRLEITESSMMADIESKIDIIGKLQRAGFIVEMDDFGSGYSSLNLLKDLSLDILKIDMVFLSQTQESERAKTILQSIVKMAKKLNMPVITEGVETGNQVLFLKGIGCDMFQGYYFSKPIPQSEFEKRFL